METNLSTLNVKRRFMIKWMLIAFSLVGIYFLAFTYLIDKRPFVEWTLIKGGPEEEKAQAQLIKMPDGKIFLINAGDASGSLLLFLKKQKIKDIDVLILSSNSSATTSGLKEMIKAGLRIKEIRTNPMVSPSSDWGSTQSISHRDLTSGETLYQNGTTHLNVVSLASNVLGLKLIHGSNSVLVILSEPSEMKSEAFRLGCDLFPVDVFLDYAESLGESKAWESCAQSSTKLGKQKGTFKILLKGDSYKWKRGR